jgi:hypothetical protein
MKRKRWSSFRLNVIGREMKYLNLSKGAVKRIRYTPIRGFLRIANVMNMEATRKMPPIIIIGSIINDNRLRKKRITSTINRPNFSDLLSLLVVFPNPLKRLDNIIGLILCLKVNRLGGLAMEPQTLDNLIHRAIR